MARLYLRLWWAGRRLTKVVTLTLVASLCLLYYEWGRRLQFESDSAPGPDFSGGPSLIGNEQYAALGGLVEWANYELEQADKERTGPGEQGVAFDVPAAAASKKDTLFRQNGFNGLASEYISVQRAVKDIRHPKCRGKHYPKKLPKCSVIVPFYNEHNATLLRTVHSVVRQSPPSLLQEVILADDASTGQWLKEPLEAYLREHFPPSLVKIVRAPEREGLIRARLRGARAASGQVLIFLDAHSECNYNWLPPLLTPIALDNKTAVCPFVDVIDYDNFEYRAQDEGARGAFDWLLYYKRLPLHKEHSLTPTEPFDDPVMAGGYFAIDAQWFWTLGGYDDGLEIWGGEQYELSFKIWQCGGRLVDAPCSRVGHIYRRYSPIGGGGRADYLSRNYKRVAVVWMDEYAEHIYARRPHYRTLDAGDVSKQLAVRQKLNCKPFDWFIKEIVPDIMQHYPPVEPEPNFRGKVASAFDSAFCVESQTSAVKESHVKLAPCQQSEVYQPGSEQRFEMTFREDIRPRRRPICWDVPQANNGAPVVLFPCHGQRGNQHWAVVPGANNKTYMLKHVPSNKCLEAEPSENRVFVAVCDTNNQKQKWLLENVKLGQSTKSVH